MTTLNKSIEFGNSHRFSQECPNQKSNPETTVETGLDSLAHQPESIYIKPDLPGDDRDNLTNGDKLTAPGEDRALKEYFAKRYDSPEDRKELAEILSRVHTVEMLLDLNECEFYDRDRYNRAARLLSKEKQDELRAIAIELDEIHGSDRPRSYLERWQRRVGKTVSAIVNYAGELRSAVGKFMALEIVNNQCMAQVIIDRMKYYCQPHELGFSSD